MDTSPELLFIEDAIKKYPTLTDIHTFGSSVAVQTPEGTFAAPYEVSPSLGMKVFSDHGLDSSLTVAGRRIRIHVALIGDNTAADLSIRIHPEKIRSLKECEATPEMTALANVRAGLILVAGHTGSRKTTLLGAYVDAINTNRDAIIVTVEDPVELVHKAKKGFVRHKEVTKELTWSSALRDLYRENADVIVIGETRDYDAINAALDLSLSGKLVFTTIHASCVEDTIRQFVSRAPADKLEVVANNLADALTAVIVQRMTLDRQFQREYMILTTPERMLIRDPKKFKEITNILQEKNRQKIPGFLAFPKEVS